VGSLGRKCGPSSVVILEDSQEGGLIADIGNVLVVQIVQSLNEIPWTAKCAYQPCLIVRHEERVFPNAAFEGLGGVVLKRTDSIRVGIDVGTLQRVLISPCLIQKFLEGAIASVVSPRKHMERVFVLAGKSQQTPCYFHYTNTRFDRI